MKNFLSLKISILIAVLLLLQGLTYSRNMIWKTEIILFADTAMKSPGKARVHFNMGEQYEKEDRVREAFAEYRQALKIAPGLPEAHNNVGVLYFTQGFVDMAIQHYYMALQQDPNNAKAHNNLGNALRRKGLIPEAIQEYTKALEIDPTMHEAKFNLEQVYAPRETNRDIAELRLKKGMFFATEGLLNKAIKEYQAALRNDSANIAIYLALGTAYLAIDDPAHAREVYRQALRIDPDCAEARRSAEILDRTGQYGLGHDTGIPGKAGD